MRDLSIVTKESFVSKSRDVLRNSIKDGFGWKKKQVLCSIDEKIEIQFSDVPEKIWEDSEWIIALGCIKPSDDAIQSKLLDIYFGDDQRLSSTAFDSVKNMLPLGPASHRKLINFILSNPSSNKFRDVLAMATPSIEGNPYKSDQLLSLAFNVMLKSEDSKLRNMGIILIANLRPKDADSLNKLKAFADVEKEYELKMRMMSILNRY